jgi:hypothetical protein
MMIIIRDILNSPPTNASRQRKGAREVEENPQEPIDGADDSIMSPLQASQLLTDEYSAKILLATYKRKISAQEISQRYGIPSARTCTPPA